MAILHVTTELTTRIDRFGTHFNAARFRALAALPGNRFGVEVQQFGEGIAVKVRHPLLRGKNRLYGFRADNLDLLADLLAWYKADNLACTVHVPPGAMTRELFQGLTDAGLWSPGSGTVPVLVLDGSVPAPSPQITVRRSGLEEKELYLDLFQQSFAAWPEQEPEYRAFQWAEDSLPGGARYIAEIAGPPVGMASFPIIDGIGYFGAAGTLPDYRQRGIQSALIQQRLRDAPALGCDLVVGGGSPGTTTFRNQERAGLRLIPSGSVWRE